jgi:hypothetical protein
MMFITTNYHYHVQDLVAKSFLLVKKETKDHYEYLDI